MDTLLAPHTLSLSPDGLQLATLPVMEHFYTLQGEGMYAGVAAYFVRLGGCDVGCVWCDVKESWPLDAHPHYALADILAWVEATPAPVVVITGGEPLMHDLDLLTERIRTGGRRAHVETSGTSPLSGHWDWMTLSPKKFKPVRPEYMAVANELKVIVYHRSDLAWAAELASEVAPACQLLLQPEWSRREQMTPLIIDFVKANPRWRVSLQTHKYMGIE